MFLFGFFLFYCVSLDFICFLQKTKENNINLIQKINAVGLKEVGRFTCSCFVVLAALSIYQAFVLFCSEITQ